MSELINIKGVSKRFDELLALDNINLTVRDGEFVAIVGSSGCGKSTLLRLIAGLLPTSEGIVEVNGHKVKGPADDVGIAFQTPVLLPWRSVVENVSLQLEVRKLPKAKYETELRRLIELVGLNGFEDRKPYELSGGMQQRVALCRALIHNPALLLMDEPFGALDAMTREQLNLELQRIWMETRKTIVLITHSIIEAVFLADRVVVMSPRPGRITKIIDVPVPRPRSFSGLGDPAFQAACDEVRTLMNASGLTE
ncbi:ABC transporter ATP-binding protein [Aureimonas fodinaquatilis]|uniref:ABC transporter ATP-binding protein n=1 Tax=Aureimonas fodinaquatilis TaxID=2565783 RepID=A0A5B0DU04_9HYPH|nr:ABC transporter ATP-binding protein [Aureimonas fodinaquatilis]KAA0969040.1 ABC transporter ATP-binding protein [Aureimonas fodinaquatilis]